MQNSKPNLPFGKQLSLIIVNYKSKQHLAKCLASLGDNLKPETEFESIIVNNDENEDLADIAGNYPQIKIVSPGKNIGFGAANNIGAKMAQGKTLCFLNPDTELIVDNLERIMSEFDRDQEIGIIGPKLIDAFGEVQWWCAGTRITLGDILRNNLGFIKSKKVWESKEKKAADWVSGAALFIKKELFEAIGGFDENFFMYFEDVDLCQRVKEKNKKVIYFPEVAIRHWGGQSSAGKAAQKENFYKSQDYYFRKHFGKLQSKFVSFLRKLHV